jgi:hypothetical protein
MATPQEIEKLLDRLDKAYKQLGEKNPFKNFDTSNLKNAEATISQLEDALEGVVSRVENAQSSFKDLSDTLKSVVKEIDPKAADATKSFASGFKNIIKEARQLQFEEEGLNKLSKKQLEKVQERIKQQQSLTKDAANQVIQEANSDAKKAGREANITSEIDRRTKAYKDLNEAQKAAVNYLREEDIQTQAIIDKTQQRIKQEERIEKLLGLGGAAVAGTKTALDKLGFGGLANALGLDEVQEKMREVAEEIEKSEGYTGGFSDKMKVLKAGIKEAGTQLKQSLKDPAAVAAFLINEMVSALTKADQATGELAKSFGTSYSAAASIRNELNTIANLSGDVNINTAALQKSLVAINKEFGTASTLNGQLLKDFTNLTTVAGYTEEAALGLSRTTLATGTDLSENTSEILGQAVAFNAVNGLALNEKEIVEGVAKASAATTLTLGMQPGKLAKAVAQAKALGVSLEQVEQISSSLLDFENSISAELEAELLTGKNLNLEKARLAALNGDIATVAEEIAKQTGKAADFTEMNVFKQEALAKAVGMTREDLAKSLIEREALAKIGAKDSEEAKKRFDLLVKRYGYEEATKRLGDEQYAQQLRSQSVQERFNASVEKLREIFVSIAEPILQIVSPFMDLVTTILPLVNVALAPITGTLKFLGESIQFSLGLIRGILEVIGEKLSPIFNVLTPLFKGFSEFVEQSKTLNTILEVTKSIVGSIVIAYGAIAAYNATAALFAKLRESSEKSTEKSLIKQGIIMLKNLGTAILEAVAKVTGASASTLGIAAGIAAAAGAAAYAFLNSKKADDMVSPGSGYGKRTLLAPEGAIQLNDKDTVIAGTNLGGKNQSANTPSSPSINLSPLVERMAAVENLLGQILSKEGTVYLDGNKVGTAMAMGTYKTQ